MHLDDSYECIRISLVQLTSKVAELVAAKRPDGHPQRGARLSGDPASAGLCVNIIGVYNLNFSNRIERFLFSARGTSLHSHLIPKRNNFLKAEISSVERYK